MKKQVLFSFCLTAASAVLVTGCATKQDVAAVNAQQEATEIAAAESIEMQQEVVADPIPPTEPVVEPAPEVVPEVPAQTPEKPAEKPAPEKKAVHPKPVAYTVTAGDSLSALSVRFGVRTPDILALNPSLRKNPNNLRIGQKVMLPPGTDVTVKAKIRAPKPAPAKGSTVYTVKSGDVLGGIALRHGVTVAAIKSANNLKSDAIWVGQKLTIPASAKKAKVVTATDPVAKKPAKKVEKPVEKPAPAAEPEVLPDVPEVPEQAGETELPPPPPAPAPVPAPGIEPVAPAAPAVDSAAPAMQDYVVGANEDLVAVALKWGVTLPELRAANNIDEASGNAIAEGTTLKIPVPAQ